MHLLRYLRSHVRYSTVVVVTEYNVNVARKGRVKIMTRNEKIELLRKLEKEDVVWQDCPTKDLRIVYPFCWPFRVLDVTRLPDEFKEEFLRFGEIRW